MPPDAQIFLFPPAQESFGVKAWSALASQTEGIAISRTCRITHLIHYKSKIKKSHEHLLFHTQLHADGQLLVGCFAVGRYRDPDASTSAISLASIATSSSLDSLDADANDRVYVPCNGQESKLPRSLRDSIETIRTLIIPPKVKFVIADLAALLPVVSNAEKTYKPLSTQCYWFANVVYACINKGVPDCTEVLGTAFPQMAKHLHIPIPRKDVGRDRFESLLAEWRAERVAYDGRQSLAQVRKI
jgi:hypothetical protein